MVMKQTVRLLITVLSGLIFSVSAFGQDSEATEKVDEKTADVAITARVEARELKFEIVPNPEVKFPGTPDRKTEWSSERKNLPTSVEPGVTYRDVGIILKIASVFADIDRIVDEALDIKPTAETKPPKERSPAADPKPKEYGRAEKTAKPPQK